ncbi:hypothetical protein SNEBB_004775 [Seison nebaliae]|nr:hypothetical protein SNEBB_004775 [Seison nebaliae]
MNYTSHNGTVNRPWNEMHRLLKYVRSEISLNDSVIVDKFQTIQQLLPKLPHSQKSAVAFQISFHQQEIIFAACVFSIENVLYKSMRKSLFEYFLHLLKILPFISLRDISCNSRPFYLPESEVFVFILVLTLNEFASRDSKLLDDYFSQQTKFLNEILNRLQNVPDSELQYVTREIFPLLFGLLRAFGRISSIGDLPLLTQLFAGQNYCMRLQKGDNIPYSIIRDETNLRWHGYVVNAKVSFFTTRLQLMLNDGKCIFPTEIKSINQESTSSSTSMDDEQKNHVNHLINAISQRMIRKKKRKTMKNEAEVKYVDTLEEILSSSFEMLPYTKNQISKLYKIFSDFITLLNKPSIKLGERLNCFCKEMKQMTNNRFPYRNILYIHDLLISGLIHNLTFKSTRITRFDLSNSTLDLVTQLYKTSERQPIFGRCQNLLMQIISVQTEMTVKDGIRINQFALNQIEETKDEEIFIQSVNLLCRINLHSTQYCDAILRLIKSSTFIKQQFSKCIRYMEHSNKNNHSFYGDDKRKSKNDNSNNIIQDEFQLNELIYALRVLIGDDAIYGHEHLNHRVASITHSKIYNNNRHNHHHHIHHQNHRTYSLVTLHRCRYSLVRCYCRIICATYYRDKQKAILYVNQLCHDFFRISQVRTTDELLEAANIILAIGELATSMSIIDTDITRNLLKQLDTRQSIIDSLILQQMGRIALVLPTTNEFNGVFNNYIQIFRTSQLLLQIPKSLNSDQLNERQRLIKLANFDIPVSMCRMTNIDTYFETIDVKYLHTLRTAFRIVESLSNRVKDDNLIDLLLKLLNVFNELAKIILEKTNCAFNWLSSSNSSGGMRITNFGEYNYPYLLGHILPSIASLCCKYNLPIVPDKSVHQSFRMFWAYSTILGFTEFPKQPNTLNEKWSRSMRIIASKAPLFIVGHMNLKSDIHYNLAINSIQLPPSTVSTLKSFILKNLTTKMFSITSECHKIINANDQQTTLFLLYLISLETTRVNCAKDYTFAFQFIFSYLQSENVQRDKGSIIELVKALANVLFENYIALTKMKQPQHRTERDQQLDKMTTFLLIKFNNLDENVRQLADSYLTKLIQNYYSLLWSPNLVTSILDISTALHYGLSIDEHLTAPIFVFRYQHTAIHESSHCDDFDNAYFFYHILKVMRNELNENQNDQMDGNRMKRIPSHRDTIKSLYYERYSLQMHQAMEKRRQAVNLFSQRSIQLLSSAFVYAPNTTMAHIEVYLWKMERINPFNFIKVQTSEKDGDDGRQALVRFNNKMVNHVDTDDEVNDDDVEDDDDDDGGRTGTTRRFDFFNKNKKNKLITDISKSAKQTMTKMGIGNRKKDGTSNTTRVSIGSSHGLKLLTNMRRKTETTRSPGRLSPNRNRNKNHNNNANNDEEDEEGSGRRVIETIYEDLQEEGNVEEMIRITGRNDYEGKMLNNRHSEYGDEIMSGTTENDELLEENELNIDGDIEDVDDDEDETILIDDVNSDEIHHNSHLHHHHPHHNRMIIKDWFDYLIELNLNNSNLTNCDAPFFADYKNQDDGQHYHDMNGTIESAGINLGLQVIHDFAQHVMNLELNQKQTLANDSSLSRTTNDTRRDYTTQHAFYKGHFTFSDLHQRRHEAMKAVINARTTNEKQLSLELQVQRGDLRLTNMRKSSIIAPIYLEKKKGIDSNSNNISTIFLTKEDVTRVLAHQLFKKLENSLDNLSTFDEALYKASAFVILSNGVEQRRILTYICHLPIYNFNEKTIHSLIDCWHWICSQRSDLSILLLKEVVNMFQKTKHLNLGMFCKEVVENMADPLFYVEHVEEMTNNKTKIGQHYLRKQKLLKEAGKSIVHLLILEKFLCEKFVGINSYPDDEEREILLYLFNTILHIEMDNGWRDGSESNNDTPSTINRSVNCSAARFRFLTLALELVQSGSIVNDICRTALREKIYRGAFDYFSSHLHLHHSTPLLVESIAARKIGVSTIKAAADFWTRLHSEKRFIFDDALVKKMENGQQQFLNSIINKTSFTIISKNTSSRSQNSDYILADPTAHWLNEFLLPSEFLNRFSNEELSDVVNRLTVEEKLELEKFTKTVILSDNRVAPKKETKLYIDKDKRNRHKKIQQTIALEDENRQNISQILPNNNVENSGTDQLPNNNSNNNGPFNFHHNSLEYTEDDNSKQPNNYTDTTDNLSNNNNHYSGDIAKGNIKFPLAHTNNSIGNAQSTLPPLTSRRNGKGGKYSQIITYANRFTESFTQKMKLLIIILADEIERMNTIYNPIERHSRHIPAIEPILNFRYQSNLIEDWKEYVRLCWYNYNSPPLACNLIGYMKHMTSSQSSSVAARPPPKDVVDGVLDKDITMTSLSLENSYQVEVRKELERLGRIYPDVLVLLPKHINFLLTQDNIAADYVELNRLLIWSAIPTTEAISLLALPNKRHPIVLQYCMRILRETPFHVLIFIIPQLVQAIRFDTSGVVRSILLSLSQSSQLLAHQMIWNMNTNIYSDEGSEKKDPDIGETLEIIVKQISRQFSGPAQKFYEREFRFFGEITSVSGQIKAVDKSHKEERRKACVAALSKIPLTDGCYIPSNPEAIVTKIHAETATPMQSAAKAPYLANFTVRHCPIEDLEDLGKMEDMNEIMRKVSMNPERQQACIFKVGDDCRQDMLALQIFNIMKTVFKNEGIELLLFPYKVVATSPGCGVIECIPRATSRDQLGRRTDESLYKYFLKKYGNSNTLKFQKAQRNFICSMAGYSLALYLLQIKDRHNGNIMIDEEGNVIHIDFGFMLDTSPGNNMKFEPEMKLIVEYMNIMGSGSSGESEGVKWFVELCVRGYLAVRPYCDDIISLIRLMLKSNLPCFRRNTIEMLYNRFQPRLSNKEAAVHIMNVIKKSMNSKRSQLYDVFQFWTNNIPF